MAGHKRAKYVIKRAVLANNYDNVLDRRARVSVRIALVVPVLSQAGSGAPASNCSTISEARHFFMPGKQPFRENNLTLIEHLQ